MKVEAFDHIHIYSKNPEEASKFYLQYFDAEKLYQKKGDSGRRIFISLGGQIIVIGPFPTDRSEVNTDNLKIKRYQHQFGIDHFGIRVKNLKAAVEELREKGVKILTEPVNGASG
ncbi:MAG: hypothetical protein HN392_04310, partial [Anaerolineae bacterium]|nr:hypothetical protein [Anaerolineae bacterium]